MGHALTQGRTQSRIAHLHKHVLKIPVSRHFHSYCVMLVVKLEKASN